MNKNKILKTIFIFLIILSLTITFVVSASAVESDSIVSFCINDYIDGLDQCYSFPFEYFSSSVDYYGQGFFCLVFPSDPSLDYLSGKCIFSLYYGEERISFDDEFSLSSYYPDFPIILDLPVYSADLSFFGGFQTVIFEYEPFIYSGVNVQYFGYYYDFPTSVDYNISLNFSSDSPTMSDSVSSGLTSSLGWVGQVVGGLTTGPIAPLLGCFAVTISVSAVLLGIYSIRRFIWGS